MTIERKMLNVDYFIQEFDEDVDSRLLKSVYESVSVILTGDAEKLATLPSDKLGETYGFIDEEGKQEFVESVLEYTGRSIEFYKRDPLYADLVNVRDLVYLVAAQPKLQNRE